MKQAFEFLRKEYVRNGNDIGIYLYAVKAMTIKMKDLHNVDTDWVYAAACHNLSSKTKTYMEDRTIGIMAALLVGNGSPFNQAKLALCDWLNISETKVKSAYYSVCNFHRLPRNKANLENKAFMKSAHFVPAKLYLDAGRMFPDRYPKASEAFIAAFKKSRIDIHQKYIRKISKAMNIDVDDTLLSFQIFEEDRSN
jgi:hypothetical protein